MAQLIQVRHYLDRQPALPRDEGSSWRTLLALTVMCALGIAASLWVTAGHREPAEALALYGP